MWILCPASAWLSGLLWLFAREALPDLHGGLQMRWQDGQWRVSQAQAVTRRFWHVVRRPAP